MIFKKCHTLTRRIAAALLASACMLAGPAAASDPSLARYSEDPTSIFWFVQISDTHIDNLASAHEETSLEWALGTAASVVQPLFIVNTGDLVDHSDGLCYWCGVQEAEWSLYRDIVDSAGMTKEFYFDIIGNHDAYADTDAFHYLTRSVQGLAQSTTQPQWRFDLPFGSYHFFSVATTCNDWQGWPQDNDIVTAEEYEEVLANLEANADANLSIGFGHHDYFSYLSPANAEQMDRLFLAYGVPFYIHGHEHEYGARVSDLGVVRVMGSALGKKDEDNYCLWAVDSDAISHRCVSALDPWPLVVVTAPVDVMLGVGDDLINPYAPPVPLDMTEAPIRVLVFDIEPVSTVTFTWDTGATGSFTESDENHAQWLATFDSTEFSEGVHDLTVGAAGSSEKFFTIQVALGHAPVAEEEPEQSPEIMPEPVPDGEAVPEAADADATGDRSEDGADLPEVNGPAKPLGGGCSCSAGSPGR
jgi:hypothetical protein